jgi:hypothetical protein
VTDNLTTTIPQSLKDIFHSSTNPSLVLVMMVYLSTPVFVIMAFVDGISPDTKSIIRLKDYQIQNLGFCGNLISFEAEIPWRQTINDVMYFLNSSH